MPQTSDDSLFARWTFILKMDESLEAVEHGKQQSTGLQEFHLNEFSSFIENTDLLRLHAPKLNTSTQSKV